MRYYSSLGCLTLAVTMAASAQDTSSVVKSDSVLTRHQTATETYTTKSSSQKTFGAEFNPARLLLGWITYVISRYTSLVESFSLFAIDRHAEIVFPLYHVFGTYDATPWRILNVDVTYRRFLDVQTGFYFSGELRYAYVAGEEFLPQQRLSIGKQISQSKFGAYAGIVYRYFLLSGFYFGTSLVAGRFFSNDSCRIVDMKIDDRPFIFDFMKVGYAFPLSHYHSTNVLFDSVGRPCRGNGCSWQMANRRSLSA